MVLEKKHVLYRSVSQGLLLSGAGRSALAGVGPESLTSLSTLSAAQLNSGRPTGLVMPEVLPDIRCATSAMLGDFGSFLLCLLGL